MTWDLHSDSTQRHARERMEVNELTSPPPRTRLFPMPTSLLSYTHWQAYTQTPDKTVGLNAGTEPRIWRLKKYHGAMSGFTLSPCTLNTAHSNRWVVNNCESNLTCITNMTCKHQLTKSKRHYTGHFSHISGPVRLKGSLPIAKQDFWMVEKCVRQKVQFSLRLAPCYWNEKG